MADSEDSEPTTGAGDVASVSCANVLEGADKNFRNLIAKICKQSTRPATLPQDWKIYKLPDGQTKAGTGTAGKTTKLVSNYLHLNITSESKKLNVHEYLVKVEPELEGAQTQKLFLHGEFSVLIGKQWIFKASKPQKLFVSHKLSEEELVLFGTHPCTPELQYTLVLQYVDKGKEQATQQMTQFCDALFTRLYKILGMTLLGSKLYDSHAFYRDPSKRLEIWPGLLTYTRYYDGGLMLGFDTTIRALKTSTCYDMLEVLSIGGVDEMRTRFAKYALGKFVMTRYNSRVYKILDIDWDQSPKSTMVVCGKQMTYVEYYKLNYGIAIKNLDQPLFVILGRCNPECWKQGGGTHVCYDRIVPELCHLMRLIETKAEHITIPQFLIRCCKLPPAKNVELIDSYANKVKKNEDCVSLLKSWDLELGDFVKAEGRVLDSPTLRFGNGVCKQVSSSVPKTCAGSTMYHPISLEKWVIFCSSSDCKIVDCMLSTMASVCARMNIKLRPPLEIVQIEHTIATIPNFNNTIRDTLSKPECAGTQLVMVIIPRSVHRREFYASLKKLLVLELKGVPSQFIRASTLLDKRQVVDMMESLVVQISCKIGGSPWALHLPEIKESLMFVGIDSYHSPCKKDRSVFAMVVSLNQACTKFYSRAVPQRSHQETGDGIGPLFAAALAAYHDESGCWPDRVIVFRDGVNNKTMELVKEYELGQMRDAAYFLEPNPPKFVFIVVQKRIIERFYSLEGEGAIGNPPLGTVLDNTLTRLDHVDFLLVSQLRPSHARAVTPVHYVVIANDDDFPIDSIQKLAHASCFMYFNYPGSFRIPGICQYAHRVSNLVGSHLKQEPVEASTHKQLYYL